MTIPEIALLKRPTDRYITYCSLEALLPYHQQSVVMERDGPFRTMKPVFPVRSIGRIELIPLEEILWIKGAANYVELQTDNGSYLHRETMQNVCDKLLGHPFLRIHRSAIVNLERIREISSELGRFSLVQLDDGTELKIGNAYRDSLFAALEI